ncbi:MAG: ABC transporter ATP-binding protein [Lachnospiraceae bacterium]|nr:ABC transporter ATP-binding protein [Lachnospiraceae bacterium]
MSDFLTVKDLVVEYTSGGVPIQAVNGVSFSMKKGSVLGLVGETGAGKTTIAKSIIRVLPEASTKKCEGTVELDGQSILELSEKEMQKVRGDKIALISQDPMTALNPIHSVGEQIMEAIQAHEEVNKKEAMAKGMELLEMVGIPKERFLNYPHEFSGGMKQRIVIAIALACNPELLLADEPTTALDVTIQAQVLDLMMKLKEERGTSMILITHDLGVVAECCDDVAVVYAGQIVESGDKYQVFHNPSHPYTRGLFNSLPQFAGNDRRLHPIPGLPPDPTRLPKGCYFSPRCPYADDHCRSAEGQLIEIEPGHVCRCQNCQNRKEGSI